MKHKDYISSLVFQNHMGNVLVPINDKAIEFLTLSKNGEELILKDATPRDLEFHRAYFGLLKYIYSLLPKVFRENCPESKFYTFIKEMSGQFSTTTVGSREIKEYTSISFSKMNQKTFQSYVANQLPIIYEEIIVPLFPNKHDKVIGLIEKEWDNFLNRLA